MFSLLKKKYPQVQNLYTSLAVNYFYVARNGRHLESTLESVYKKCLHRYQGGFSKYDIDQMCEETKCNLWEAIIWQDMNDLELHGTVIRAGNKQDVLRWESYKKSGASHTDYTPHFERVSRDCFYSEQELKDLGEIIGVDYFKDCEWRWFSKVEYLRSGSLERIIYFKDELYREKQEPKGM